MVEKNSGSGHIIREYVGDIGETFAAFRSPSRAMRVKTQSELRGNR